MDHRDAWELLPDVAADCCAQDERLAVEAHVRTCEACAAELDALRRAHAVLTTAGPPVEPPASLRERVLAIPDAPAAGRSAPVPPRAAPEAPRARRATRPTWRVAALSAALAVAATLALVVALGRGGGPFDGSHAIALHATGHAPGAWGSASVGRAQGGNLPVRVQVGGLRNPPANGFYEVWLGAPGRRLSLGKLVVGSDGRATVTLNMPANTRHEYPWVWITRERDDDNAAPSPDTVLKGSIA